MTLADDPYALQVTQLARTQVRSDMLQALMIEASRATFDPWLAKWGLDKGSLTASSDIPDPDLDAPDLSVYDEWADELITPYLRQTVVDAQGDVIADYGVLPEDSPIRLTNPQSQQALEERTNRIRGAAAYTWSSIQGELRQGIEDGDGIPQLADRIRGKVDETYTGRYETIARTEVIGATNEAQAKIGKDLDLGARQWLATLDDRTRDSHLKAHGAIALFDQPFYMALYGGEGELMYPGDPGGPASEVINCRCTLIYPEATDGKNLTPGPGWLARIVQTIQQATKRVLQLQTITSAYAEVLEIQRGGTTGALNIASQLLREQVDVTIGELNRVIADPTSILFQPLREQTAVLGTAADWIDNALAQLDGGRAAANQAQSMQVDLFKVKATAKTRPAAEKAKQVTDTVEQIRSAAALSTAALSNWGVNFPTETFRVLVPAPALTAIADAASTAATGVRQVEQFLGTVTEQLREAEARVNEFTDVAEQLVRNEVDGAINTVTDPVVARLNETHDQILGAIEFFEGLKTPHEHSERIAKATDPILRAVTKTRPIIATARGYLAKWQGGIDTFNQTHQTILDTVVKTRDVIQTLGLDNTFVSEKLEQLDQVLTILDAPLGDLQTAIQLTTNDVSSIIDTADQTLNDIAQTVDSMRTVALEADKFVNRNEIAMQTAMRYSAQELLTLSSRIDGIASATGDSATVDLKIHRKVVAAAGTTMADYSRQADTVATGLESFSQGIGQLLTFMDQEGIDEIAHTPGETGPLATFLREAVQVAALEVADRYKLFDSGYAETAQDIIDQAREYTDVLPIDPAFIDRLAPIPDWLRRPDPADGLPFNDLLTGPPFGPRLVGRDENMEPIQADDPEVAAILERLEQARNDDTDKVDLDIDLMVEGVTDTDSILKGVQDLAASLADGNDPDLLVELSTHDRVSGPADSEVRQISEFQIETTDRGTKRIVSDAPITRQRLNTMLELMSENPNVRRGKDLFDIVMDGETLGTSVADNMFDDEYAAQRELVVEIVDDTWRTYKGNLTYRAMNAYMRQLDANQLAEANYSDDQVDEATYLAYLGWRQETRGEYTSEANDLLRGKMPEPSLAFNNYRWDNLVDINPKPDGINSDNTDQLRFLGTMIDYEQAYIAAAQTMENQGIEATDLIERGWVQVSSWVEGSEVDFEAIIDGNFDPDTSADEGRLQRYYDWVAAKLDEDMDFTIDEMLADEATTEQILQRIAETDPTYSKWADHEVIVTFLAQDDDNAKAWVNDTLELDVLQTLGYAHALSTDNREAMLNEYLGSPADYVQELYDAYSQDGGDPYQTNEQLGRMIDSALTGRPFWDYNPAFAADVLHAAMLQSAHRFEDLSTDEYPNDERPDAVEALLYRGSSAATTFGIDNVSDLDQIIGAEFHDNGFISTTHQPRTATGFLSTTRNTDAPIIFVYRGDPEVAGDTALIQGNSGEAEVILQPGTSARVTDVVEFDYKDYSGDDATKAALVFVDIIGNEYGREPDRPDNRQDDIDIEVTSEAPQTVGTTWKVAENRVDIVKVLEDTGDLALRQLPDTPQAQQVKAYADRLVAAMATGDPFELGTADQAYRTIVGDDPNLLNKSEYLAQLKGIHQAVKAIADPVDGIELDFIFEQVAPPPGKRAADLITDRDDLVIESDPEVPGWSKISGTDVGSLTIVEAVQNEYTEGMTGAQVEEGGGYSDGMSWVFDSALQSYTGEGYDEINYILRSELEDNAFEAVEALAANNGDPVNAESLIQRVVDTVNWSDVDMEYMFSFIDNWANGMAVAHQTQELDLDEARATFGDDFDEFAELMGADLNDDDWDDDDWDDIAADAYAYAIANPDEVKNWETITDETDFEDVLLELNMRVDEYTNDVAELELGLKVDGLNLDGVVADPDSREVQAYVLKEGFLRGDNASEGYAPGESSILYRGTDAFSVFGTSDPGEIADRYVGSVIADMGMMSTSYNAGTSEMFGGDSMMLLLRVSDRSKSPAYNIGGGEGEVLWAPGTQIEIQEVVSDDQDNMVVVGEIVGNVNKDYYTPTDDIEIDFILSPDEVKFTQQEATEALLNAADKDLLDDTNQNTRIEPFQKRLNNLEALLQQHEEQLTEEDVKFDKATVEVAQELGLPIIDVQFWATLDGLDGRRELETELDKIVDNDWLKDLAREAFRRAMNAENARKNIQARIRETRGLVDAARARVDNFTPAPALDVQRDPDNGALVITPADGVDLNSSRVPVVIADHHVNGITATNLRSNYSDWDYDIERAYNGDEFAGQIQAARLVYTHATYREMNKYLRLIEGPINAELRTEAIAAVDNHDVLGDEGPSYNSVQDPADAWDNYIGLGADVYSPLMDMINSQFEFTTNWPDGIKTFQKNWQTDNGWMNLADAQGILWLKNDGDLVVDWDEVPEFEDLEGERVLEALYGVNPDLLTVEKHDENVETMDRMLEVVDAELDASQHVEVLVEAISEITWARFDPNSLKVVAERWETLTGATDLIRHHDHPVNFEDQLIEALTDWDEAGNEDIELFAAATRILLQAQHNNLGEKQHIDRMILDSPAAAIWRAGQEQISYSLFGETMDKLKGDKAPHVTDTMWKDMATDVVLDQMAEHVDEDNVILEMYHSFGPDDVQAAFNLTNEELGEYILDQDLLDPADFGGGSGAYMSDRPVEAAELLKAHMEKHVDDITEHIGDDQVAVLYRGVNARAAFGVSNWKDLADQWLDVVWHDEAFTSSSSGSATAAGFANKPRNEDFPIMMAVRVDEESNSKVMHGNDGEQELFWSPGTQMRVDDVVVVEQGEGKDPVVTVVATVVGNIHTSPYTPPTMLETNQLTLDLDMVRTDREQAERNFAVQTYLSGHPDYTLLDPPDAVVDAWQETTEDLTDLIARFGMPHTVAYVDAPNAGYAGVNLGWSNTRLDDGRTLSYADTATAGAILIAAQSGKYNTQDGLVSFRQRELQETLDELAEADPNDEGEIEYLNDLIADIRDDIEKYSDPERYEYETFAKYLTPEHRNSDDQRFEKLRGLGHRNIRSTMRHEYAHSVQKWLDDWFTKTWAEDYAIILGTDDRFDKGNFSHRQKAQRQSIARYIGEYALTNPSELFAETFSMVSHPDFDLNNWVGQPLVYEIFEKVQNAIYNEPLSPALGAEVLARTQAKIDGQVLIGPDDVFDGIDSADPDDERAIADLVEEAARLVGEVVESDPNGANLILNDIHTTRDRNAEIGQFKEANLNDIKYGLGARLQDVLGHDSFERVTTNAADALAVADAEIGADIVGKWGAPKVVSTKNASPKYDNMTAALAFEQGTKETLLLVNEDSLTRIENLDTTAPVLPNTTGKSRHSMTLDSRAAVIRHEYGHYIDVLEGRPSDNAEFLFIIGDTDVRAHVQDQGIDGAVADGQAVADAIRTHIGEYAMTNNRETFAELFAVVSNPHYDRAQWDSVPEVQQALDWMTAFIENSEPPPAADPDVDSAVDSFGADPLSDIDIDFLIGGGKIRYAELDDKQAKATIKDLRAIKKKHFGKATKKNKDARDAFDATFIAPIEAKLRLPLATSTYDIDAAAAALEGLIAVRFGEKINKALKDKKTPPRVLVKAGAKKQLKDNAKWVEAFKAANDHMTEVILETATQEESDAIRERVGKPRPGFIEAAKAVVKLAKAAKKLHAKYTATQITDANQDRREKVWQLSMAASFEARAKSAGVNLTAAEFIQKHASTDRMDRRQQRANATKAQYKIQDAKDWAEREGLEYSDEVQKQYDAIGTEGGNDRTWTWGDLTIGMRENHADKNQMRETRGEDGLMFDLEARPDATRAEIARALERWTGEGEFDRNDDAAVDAAIKKIAGRMRAEMGFLTEVKNPVIGVHALTLKKILESGKFLNSFHEDAVAAADHSTKGKNIDYTRQNVEQWHGVPAEATGDDRGIYGMDFNHQDPHRMYGDVILHMDTSKMAKVTHMWGDSWNGGRPMDVNTDLKDMSDFEVMLLFPQIWDDILNDRKIDPDLLPVKYHELQFYGAEGGITVDMIAGYSIPFEYYVDDKADPAETQALENDVRDILAAAGIEEVAEGDRQLSRLNQAARGQSGAEGYRLEVDIDKRVAEYEEYERSQGREPDLDPEAWAEIVTDVVMNGNHFDDPAAMADILREMLDDHRAVARSG